MKTLLIVCVSILFFSLLMSCAHKYLETYDDCIIKCEFYSMDHEARDCICHPE